jgi:hypothetical protein
MQRLYSTMAFIETLRPEKHGFVARLIDPISGASYGWIFELGPVVILKVTGWHGEKVMIIKIGGREWVI